MFASLKQFSFGIFRHSWLFFAGTIPSVLYLLESFGLRNALKSSMGLLGITPEESMMAGWGVVFGGVLYGIFRTYHELWVAANCGDWAKLGYVEYAEGPQHVAKYIPRSIAIKFRRDWGPSLDEYARHTFEELVKSERIPVYRALVDLQKQRVTPEEVENMGVNYMEFNEKTVSIKNIHTSDTFRAIIKRTDIAKAVKPLINKTYGSRFERLLKAMMNRKSNS